MRAIWTLLSAGTLILASVNSTQAQDDPKAIVEKAIEASGGAKALDKYKAGKISGKGTVSVMGMDLEFTMDSTYQSPGKLKNSIELDAGGMKLTIDQIINGDRAVTKVNGVEQPLTDTRAKELKLSAEAQELFGLTAMLDKKYTLTKLDKEVKIDGKPAVGLSITRKGWDKPMKFYFDTKSNLLVGADREGLTPEEQMATLRQTFTEYKKIQGTMQPTHIEVLADDMKFMSMDFEKIELLEKVPAQEFAIGDD